MDEHSSRQALRPLLPRPDGIGRTPQVRLSSARSRRATVRAACNPCRDKRMKCDGQRPTCTACSVRVIQCKYVTSDANETRSQALKRKAEELEGRKNAAEEIYELLQNRPEEEVAVILRRIREGANPEHVLRQVQDGDLLLQLALVPEARYRYDFPYNKRMPKALIISNNTYLESPIFERAWADISASSLYPITRAREDNGLASSSMYLIPYHAAEVSDPLLADAKISEWTTVTSNESLLRKLLAAYIKYDAGFLTALHKEHFLYGLVENRPGYCSSLLVNAVLATACQMYEGLSGRQEFWNPQNLTYRFLAEAERLWRLEDGKSRLTTVQAAIIIQILYGINGLDKVGHAYLLQGLAMAHDMNLFLPTPEGSSARMRNTRHFTAWCLFNHQVNPTYYFFKPPLLEEPPKIALPDPSKDPTWYGHIRVRYPQNAMPVDTSFGFTFRAACKLRVIMNAITSAMFKKPGELTRLSTDTTLTLYSKLCDWFVQLPEPLLPQRIVFPNQIKIHAQYHTVVIRLFEPLLATAAALEHNNIRLNPLRIVSHAKSQVETLIRLNYLRHGFEYFDPFLVTLLLTVSFEAQTDLERATISSSDRDSSQPSVDEIRSTLILCAKGMYDQSHNYYVGHLLFHLFLGRTTPAEIELLKRFLPSSQLERNQGVPQERVRSEWPLPIIKIDEDPRTSKLETLVKDYQRLAVDSEEDLSA
ncbi:hypothetical protein BDV96DRAFT_587169 [Lophiotrema nucula]|uniref:Zn(2)-C6 fungal-type domain-containing protein n=1 Tax=Lophiotrema nucula TaxID=690887 RepID=A0A6A5YNM0_9PLEO|nr:hypothetical protein BDV96DRAFT_587169 [Lophiotrema nucula]